MKIFNINTPFTLEDQQEFIERVNKLSNRELLDLTIEESAPDWYDDTYTPRGRWVMHYLNEKLYKLLEDIGWL